MLVLTGLLATGFVAITAAPALGAGSFAKTGSMSVARISHTATLLANGEVLVAGGDNSSLGGGYLASAELYNPATGSWTLTGSMTTPRERHQAVLLSSGEVLVAGGSNASGTLASADLYNPSTGTWTPTGGMNTARSSFSLTPLTDGEVLAVLVPAFRKLGLAVFALPELELGAALQTKGHLTERVFHGCILDPSVRC
jgi:hypothetical protein